MTQNICYHLIALFTLLSITSCANQWQQRPLTITTAPQQLALLVPLQGPLEHLGKAIRNGFFAAYYQKNQQQSPHLSIRVYDSSQGDIRQTYQRAIDEGADFVVGPLAKNNVKRLSMQWNLAQPTLALNTVGNLWPVNKALIQFGLAPQEEATQVAKQARLDHHEQAIVIVSADYQGSSMAKAFNKTWHQQGGRVTAQLNFKAHDNLSQALKKLLQVNAQPAATLHAEQTEEEEETPIYRRQDVDMIFLATSALQARQILPLLKFYYAGDIPVYATSLIYTGTSNPHDNQDLEGVIFTDMPWILSSRFKQRRSMNMPRLYALGADAYFIATHLHHGSIDTQGNTGYLRLHNQRIERTLSVATFNNGVAIPYRPAYQY